MTPGFGTGDNVVRPFFLTGSGLMILLAILGYEWKPGRQTDGMGAINAV
jgi:hypothetical protein